MVEKWVSLLGVVVLTALASSPAAAKTKEEQQAEVRAQSDQTLALLYKARPSAKATVAAAAGYATFCNFGLKILVAGGGKGKGLAIDNASKKATYMKMLEVQAGFGMGAKKFRTIFVFETKEAMQGFVDNGWEFGGQATAAATTGDKGGSYQGAVAVMPGVWMYQLTEKGLALELTGKGTKYFKDDDLN